MPDDVGQVIAPWMQTASGRAFDLLTPRPAQVSLDDIAHALARIARFSGHTPEVWSVAAHSRLVTRIVAQRSSDRELRLAALLHDAHEAYLGDMTRPVKEALAWLDPGARETWRLLEQRIQGAIHHAFGLPAFLPVAWSDAIHHADACALHVEGIMFMTPFARPWHPLPVPDCPVPALEPCSPAEDARLFATLLRDLLP